MKRYNSIRGDAGVTHYQIGEGNITVRFGAKAAYLFTYARTGKQEVQMMQKLATAGDGLTTYINQYVRDRYAAKVE